MRIDDTDIVFLDIVSELQRRDGSEGVVSSCGRRCTIVLSTVRDDDVAYIRVINRNSSLYANMGTCDLISQGVVVVSRIICTWQTSQF